MLISNRNKVARNPLSNETRGYVFLSPCTIDTQSCRLSSPPMQSLPDFFSRPLPHPPPREGGYLPENLDSCVWLNCFDPYFLGPLAIPPRVLQKSLLPIDIIIFNSDPHSDARQYTVGSQFGPSLRRTPPRVRRPGSSPAAILEPASRSFLTNTPEGGVVKKRACDNTARIMVR